MSYPVARPIASRPLVVGAYHGKSDGRLQAERPSSCPDHNADEVACRVLVNHYRVRKTGPKFPLLVAMCRTHRKAFTVYPPGHVPYGRVPLAHLAPDGGEVQRQHDAPAARTRAGTLFEAAQDAAAGRRWARSELLEEVGPWWNTQVRQVAVTVKLMGLSPELSESEREKMATALGVPLFDLLVGAKSIAESPGYRSRGAAVLSVLELVPQTACTIDRLLVAGHLGGLWGALHRWDATIGCLRTPAMPMNARRGPPQSC